MNINKVPQELVNKIHLGDNIILFKNIPDSSINCIITSPPYYQQRDYGNGWGTNESMEDYITKLINVFRECIRVIKDDGHIIFNVGDKYIKSNLILMPFKFAVKVNEIFPKIKLINNITWVKTNPTPRQFKRRLVAATEQFFDFVKSNKYYYDRDSFLEEDVAIKNNKTIKVSPEKGKKYIQMVKETENLTEEEKKKALNHIDTMLEEIRDGKITDFRMKIRGIHSAAYGGHEGGRRTEIKKNGYTMIRMYGKKMKMDYIINSKETVSFSKHPAMFPKKLIEKLLVLLTKERDVVLDPYMGSGSTALACIEKNRKFIGFEISPEYCKYSEKRIFELMKSRKEILGKNQESISKFF